MHKEHKKLIARRKLLAEFHKACRVYNQYTNRMNDVNVVKKMIVEYKISEENITKAVIAYSPGNSRKDHAKHCIDEVYKKINNISLDKKIQAKKSKMFNYIRGRFDLKVVKLYWSSLLSIRVKFQDDEEIVILYDDYKNKVVEKSIGKAPILKCRDCGMFFTVLKGQSCNCSKEERLFVDIDDMYYYIRVCGDATKLEVIRSIKREL